MSILVPESRRCAPIKPKYKFPVVPCYKCSLYQSNNNFHMNTFSLLNRLRTTLIKNFTPFNSFIYFIILATNLLAMFRTTLVMRRRKHPWCSVDVLHGFRECRSKFSEIHRSSIVHKKFGLLGQSPSVHRSHNCDYLRL